MKTGHHRRPIWQPSAFSRLLDVLKGLLKHLTFKGAVIAILVLPVLFYVGRELRHDALIIEPFSVPKRFEEIGLTPEVVANRIGDAMRAIETSAQTQMKKDNLTSLRDQGSTPDVEIPGTKLGLKTLVEVTRAVLGRHPRHVSGDIVLTSADSSPAKPQLKVTIYITEGKKKSQPILRVVDSNDKAESKDVDALAQDAAAAVLEQVNPYVLAIYRYDHGEAGKAVELLEHMVEDPSQDRFHVAAAFNFMGEALKDQKRYDEAIINYQKATEFDPKFAWAYSNWGVVLYYEKKYDKAVVKYHKAIELDPKFADAYNNWGIVLRAQGEYDQAAVKYQKAIELDPKFADAYNNWGNVLYSQKKYDEAAIKYQKAIDLDPKFAIAYNNWGEALREQGKYAEAIAKYRKTIELDPKYTDPYVGWGNVLSNQKKYNEAIAKYQKAIELDPKYADAYNNWGNVLRAQGKNDEAEKKFAKARELSK